MDTLKQKEILELKGVTLSVHCPSEESLVVKMDCSHLTGMEFLELEREIQDYIIEISSEWSARDNWDGTGKVESESKKYVKYDKRRRKIAFTPFPMRFRNIISYARDKLYNKINSECITIQRHASGRFRRNVYILPENKIETFLAWIEMLNAELDELRQMIREFDLSKINEILARYDLPQLDNDQFYISNIEVDVIPIKLSVDVIEDWANKSPRLAEYLRRKREEYVKEAIEQIRQKLIPIIESFNKNMTLKRARERLEQIRELCYSTGLRALADTVIDDLIRYVDNPLGYRRIHGRPPTTKDIDERLESMLKRLL